MPILGPAPNANPVTNLKENFTAIQGPWLIGATLQAMMTGVIIVQYYD